MKTDYEDLAARYANHRRIHPEVLACLSGALNQAARVLEVGCGTGNYICALRKLVGCDCVGLDPSAAMLEKMQGRACDVQSVQGTAELKRWSGPEGSAIHGSLDQFDVSDDTEQQICVASTPIFGKD
jgi:SAM-dependent methyltransferase